MSQEQTADPPVRSPPLPPQSKVQKKGAPHKNLKIGIIVVIVAAVLLFVLPLVAWLYLNSYWEGLTGESLEVTDSICVDEKGVVFVRNTGTKSINTDGIKISRTETGQALVAGNDYTWADARENPITKIEPGLIGRVTIDCGLANLCKYGIVLGGRSLTATVQC